MKINLGGVEAATEKESTFKVVKKGVQPLTIVEVTETVAASGTEGIEVTFQASDEATFKHKFWTSAKALPRVVYLIEKFTEKPVPIGDLGIEVLSALLVGKTRPVVVDARLVTSKDGKYTNEYPELRFSGFVDPIGKDAEPRVEDTTIAVAPMGNALNALSTEGNSDLPF